MGFSTHWGEYAVCSNKTVDQRWRMTPQWRPDNHFWYSPMLSDERLLTTTALPASTWTLLARIKIGTTYDMSTPGSDRAFFRTADGEGVGVNNPINYDAIVAIAKKVPIHRQQGVEYASVNEMILHWSWDDGYFIQTIYFSKRESQNESY